MASRILWAVVGGFLVGVLIRSVFSISLTFAAFAFLLAIASLALILVERPRTKALIVIAVAFFALAGGIARMDAAILVGDPALTVQLDKKVVLEGEVFAEPDVRDNGVRISVNVERLVVGSTTSTALSASTVPVRGGVLVLAPPHTDISYGDLVRASGTLRLPEAFDTGLGRQFHYPEYLAKDGIGYQLIFAQVAVTKKYRGEASMRWPKYWAVWVKQKFLSGLQSVLPEPEAGLAGGITVGDKRSIGKELSADFQRVSLIHMIVLSGYNITVVINAVAYALAALSRSLQFGASGFVALFFVLMSGGAASATRAGAMALVAVLARATGRIFLAGRILGVIAFLMVLWDPFTLAFDPSFQLSALATIGLIVFTPMFAARLPWVTARFGLREIAASTLSTQLAVLPLLLYQNGQLSLVALPANLLALLPVPFAMFASFIAAVGGMVGHVIPVLGGIGVLLAFPAYALLAYIIGIAKFFAALPFASVSIAAFSAWWLVPAYGALAWVAYVGRRVSPNEGRMESN